MPTRLNFLMLAVLAVLALPTAAFAQDDESITAEEAIAEAREYYSVKEPATQACESNELDSRIIVVCRETVDPERYMSPLPEDIDSEDPNLPRAPDVSGLPPTSGLTVGFCGLQCPPETAIMIDLEAIPEAPPGSDAARYREEP